MVRFQREPTAYTPLISCGVRISFQKSGLVSGLPWFTGDGGAVTLCAGVTGQMPTTRLAASSLSSHFKYTPPTGSVMMIDRYSAPESMCRIISLRVRPSASRQRSSTKVSVVFVPSVSIFSLTVVCLPEYGAPLNPVPDVVWRGTAGADWPKETGACTMQAGATMSRTATDHGAIRT